MVASVLFWLFQDLQTAVVIANEMKSETQDSMEQIKDENIQLKEKNQVLQVNP